MRAMGTQVNPDTTISFYISKTTARRSVQISGSPTASSALYDQLMMMEEKSGSYSIAIQVRNVYKYIPDPFSWKKSVGCRRMGI